MFVGRENVKCKKWKIHLFKSQSSIAQFVYPISLRRYRTYSECCLLLRPTYTKRWCRNPSRSWNSFPSCFSLEIDRYSRINFASDPEPIASVHTCRPNKPKLYNNITKKSVPSRSIVHPTITKPNRIVVFFKHVCVFGSSSCTAYLSYAAVIPRRIGNASRGHV